MNISNYGFSGLAITLPKVWQEFDKNVDEHIIRHDKQAQYIAKTLVDLTEGIWNLGVILRYDRGLRRIRNRTSKKELYHTYGSARSFVQDKIEVLMNNALIIGEMGLSLLETMWMHLARLNEEKADECAYMLVTSTYNKAMEHYD